MPEPITDIVRFPKPERSDYTIAANPLIHKYMSHVLAGRQPGETISDPQSQVAKRATELVRRFLHVGIDEHRIATVSAIAHADFFRGTQRIANCTPEDFGAEA